MVFDRPVGAEADIKELEYVSALLQTDMPDLRKACIATNYTQLCSILILQMTKRVSLFNSSLLSPILNLTFSLVAQHCSPSNCCGYIILQF